MDDAAELGRNPVSEHQIQPEYGDEQADARRVQPSRPASACSSHTQAESGAYLRDPSRVPRRRPFLKPTYIHTSSGQFRVYRVTQLRTDGVHCRESAGTGSVNNYLKVVPNE